MKYRRKADNVLKLYARELMMQREEDYDAFMGKTTPIYSKISPKHFAKRCLLIAIVLTLSFALIIVSANALGIKIFGFELFQKSTHTEFIPNEREFKKETYFIPIYIPKNYKKTDSDSVNPDQKIYMYQNNREEMLFIIESYSENPGINLSNEECNYHQEIIQEHEVYIYDYEDNYSAWLLQKDGTFIMIYGILPESEFEKIVGGLTKE